VKGQRWRGRSWGASDAARFGRGGQAKELTRLRVGEGAAFLRGLELVERAEELRAIRRTGHQPRRDGVRRFGVEPAGRASIRPLSARHTSEAGLSVIPTAPRGHRSRRRWLPGLPLFRGVRSAEDPRVRFRPSRAPRRRGAAARRPRARPSRSATAGAARSIVPASLPAIGAPSRVRFTTWLSASCRPYRYSPCSCGVARELSSSSTRADPA
jgi:hypothetical protein